MGDSDTEEFDVYLLILKIVFIIVVFLLAFLTGLIPVKCKKFKGSPAIIGVANAFSGGVFLSIGLIHVLPEENEKYNDYAKAGLPEGEDVKVFPLPFFLAFCGYAFILMVDKVMFDSHALVHGEHGHDHDHSEHHEDHDHEKELGHDHKHENGHNHEHDKNKDEHQHNDSHK